MVRPSHAASSVFLGAVAFALASVPTGATAQDTNGAGRDAAPRVYVDCRRCDTEHIRREITLVNYVREPALAQVHVLITDQTTGSGGRLYTLHFEGRGPFAGAVDTLSYASAATATAAEERAGLTHVLGLGLVRYIARTPLADRVDLGFGSVEDSVAPVRDPWKHWTFEVYGGGNVSAEASQSAWNARYGFYANRVTEDWKVRLRPYFNNNARSVQTDGGEVRVDHKRHGFESHLIRSVGSHWGAGIFAEYRTSTLDNLRHSLVVAPAVEYSLFPYAEASSRQVTLAYHLGVERANYIEETIYLQTTESLVNQSLEAAIRIQQPWGSVYSGLTGSAYVHDLSHHRLTFNGEVSLRIGGGVSLNVGGRYERINDQLSLPRGDASLEDILLARRRLATSYRTSGSIGLSYTFGSIFTNVVNPRL